MKHAEPTTSFARVLRCAIIVLGASVASWAIAEEPSTVDSQKAEKTAPADRVVCTREPVTGSNIKRKVCRTQSQLDAERDASRQGMNDLNKSVGRPGGRARRARLLVDARQVLTTRLGLCIPSSHRRRCPMTAHIKTSERLS